MFGGGFLQVTCASETVCTPLWIVWVHAHRNKIQGTVRRGKATCPRVIAEALGEHPVLCSVIAAHNAKHVSLFMLILHSSRRVLCVLCGSTLVRDLEFTHAIFGCTLLAHLRSAYCRAFHDDE